MLVSFSHYRDRGGNRLQRASHLKSTEASTPPAPTVDNDYFAREAAEICHCSSRRGSITIGKGKRPAARAGLSVPKGWRLDTLRNGEKTTLPPALQPHTSHGSEGLTISVAPARHDSAHAATLWEPLLEPPRSEASQLPGWVTVAPPPPRLVL